MKKAKVLLKQKKTACPNPRRFPWKPVSMRMVEESNKHMFSQSSFSSSPSSQDSCSSALGLEFLSNIDGPSTPVDTPSMSPPTPANDTLNCRSPSSQTENRASNDINGLSTPTDPPSMSPPTPASNLLNCGSSSSQTENLASNDIMVPDSQVDPMNKSVSSVRSNESGFIAESQPETSTVAPTTSTLRMPSSALSRIGSEAFLPLPLKSFPNCPEQGCNFTFVADSFINICRVINMHFKKEH